jgi:hypothetical protein
VFRNGSRDGHVTRSAGAPGLRRGHARPTNPTEDDMNTRTIATIALAIAVLLLLFLVILPRL